MHNYIVPIFVALLAASSARADMAPTWDRGPYSGSAGGLKFSIESVTYEMHGYSKTGQVVVLDGCVDGTPNCALARSKNLIGMEVNEVDGEYLRPENGMVRQILDAFAKKAAGRTITLQLYSRLTGVDPVNVAFVRG